MSDDYWLQVFGKVALIRDILVVLMACGVFVYGAIRTAGYDVHVDFEFDLEPNQEKQPFTVFEVVITAWIVGFFIWVFLP